MTLHIRTAAVGDAHESYVAFDELLANPRVRLLRALRHFDWATSEDLKIAIDVCYSDDPREAEAFNQTLRRMFLNRQVERRGKHPTFEYRITKVGREALKTMFARPLS